MCKRPQRKPPCKKHIKQKIYDNEVLVITSTSASEEKQVTVPTPVYEISEKKNSMDYRTAKSLRITEDKKCSQDRRDTMLGSRRYL